MKSQRQQATGLYDSQIAKETLNREPQIIRICRFPLNAIVTDLEVGLTDGLLRQLRQVQSRIVMSDWWLD